MRIAFCKVNHLTNPLGFDMKKTVFSWKVEEAKGKKQTAARIIVSLHEDCAEPLADTGWREELDSLASAVEVQLQPRSRYYWQVSVRSDAGEEATSDVQWFEAAKMDEPWQAQWIGCEDAPRHPVYYKEIGAVPDAVSARLYITGLGLYEAHWSGIKIGEEHLTPYCNAYDHWVQYQTFDVTEQVRQGGKLSVELGNGWYKGRFGFDDRTGKGFYGDSWKLLAELRVQLVDGTEQVIGTDESWQRTDSTITFSNIYDGEHRDDTLPETAPVPASLTDAPEGKLTARLSLPVRTQMEMPVKEIIHTPAGETVLDLGQEITGGFRLRVREPRGAKIHLQFGEILQGGNFYRDNLRTAKAEYWYTANGKEAIIEPTFTFYGYRYVKVEGLSAIRPEDFVGLCWWSEMDKTGSLETGAPLINRLIANAEWGHLDNFLDVPTDCPQRDERMGWTGDAQVFAPTACFQRDSYAFFKKYLCDMGMEQKSRDGMVPDVVPAFGLNTCSCAWGDAAIIIPWHLYQIYGDKSILAEQFDSMKAWVDWIDRTDGDDHGWRDHFHYGDWLALDGKGGPTGLKGGTEDGFVADVFAMHMHEIVSEAARVLGNPSTADEYAEKAAHRRADIAYTYYTPSGRCAIDTQTAQLLTWRHHLGPDSGQSGDRLVELLRKNNFCLATGFVGTPMLAETLTQLDRSDIAYHLLLNEDFPGWLYAVKLGATTIWERWNSVNPDGSISSTGMNSLNHYSYGSIVRWIYEQAAGLRQDMDVPGFRRAIVAPQVDRRMKKITASYDSPSGTWKSAWEILPDEDLHVALTVPFGCNARICLPLSDQPTIEVNAGSYEWQYTPDHPYQKTYTADMPMEELINDPVCLKMLKENFPAVTILPPAGMRLHLKDLLHQYAGNKAELVLARITEKLKELSKK